MKLAVQDAGNWYQEILHPGSVIVQAPTEACLSHSHYGDRRIKTYFTDLSLALYPHQKIRYTISLLTLVSQSQNGIAWHPKKP